MGGGGGGRDGVRRRLLLREVRSLAPAEAGRELLGAGGDVGGRGLGLGGSVAAAWKGLDRASGAAMKADVGADSDSAWQTQQRASGQSYTLGGWRGKRGWQQCKGRRVPRTPPPPEAPLQLWNTGSPSQPAHRISAPSHAWTAARRCAP